MAKILRDEKGGLVAIFATETGGEEVKIFTERQKNFVLHLFANLIAASVSPWAALAGGGSNQDDGRVYIKSVYDARGGLSFANTILYTKDASGKVKDRLRLRDTVDELQAVFREAGVEQNLPAPRDTVTRWIGKLFSAELS
ncbi:MAG: hypothetical protein LRZ85_08810 [Alphaproteobacteria bacterium]|nr:hypothetical protein [Alphaproteobacteria bacterium]MCD8570171.1 hypothetical protein [Alphaproteobacteria bacterium]